MAKRTKQDSEWDDLTRWQPMTCAVCTDCLQDMRHLRLTGAVRCAFGGPFTGYEKVETR